MEAWRVVHLKWVSLGMMMMGVGGREGVKWDLYTCLQEPRPELPVYQDVKPEDLKACTAFVVLGEAGPVVVLQHWVSRNDCLDDDILFGEEEEEEEEGRDGTSEVTD